MPLAAIVTKPAALQLSAPRQDLARAIESPEAGAQEAAAKARTPYDRLGTVVGSYTPRPSANWNKRGLKIKIYWPIGLLILMDPAPGEPSAK